MIMLTLLIIMVIFLILDIVSSPYLSISINFIKQLSQVAIMGLFVAELAQIAGDTAGLRTIANVFAIAPNALFYFFVALEF